MDIWKVNEFNFLNEEVEKFTNRWIRSPKEKNFEYCL